MKVIQDNIPHEKAQRTLVFDAPSGHYFMVSSIPEETLIFRSDADGNITHSYIDVWGTSEIEHKDVINLLVTEQLTTEYFYNMEEN